MKKLNFRWSFSFFLILMSVSICASANELETAPAPEGDAVVVSTKIITDNFEKSDCPLVVKAERLQDGAIRAVCSNGEAFRIFTVVKLNMPVALRCSAAEKLGIPDC